MAQTMPPLHRWDVSVEEAIALQGRLRPLAPQAPPVALDQIRTVAGVDGAYDEAGRGRAAVVVYALPDLEIVEQATAVKEVSFPYVPGLLSFREGPVALAAVEQLRTQPGLLIFDGQGYAHPRRFGLACHLGLYLGRPSIGCAKTRLIGTYEEPGPNQGDCAALRDGEEVIGMVVRTRAGTKPVFVSVGYGIDLPTAVAVVLRCVRGYRLPEPIRAADRLANRLD
jgi:deoxyribonuclease V